MELIRNEVKDKMKNKIVKNYGLKNMDFPKILRSPN